ncbi:TraX family protein [uncultured Ruminococcus sp.]|uniref:TraX family protein n=1 Tax=uncultured Ruminococcus sp. TaxID=165186 RepID=UPI0025EFE3EB|nr:TraX family protein [uncultured Ruminococcus sp.]
MSYDSFTAFSYNYGALLALIPIQLYSGERDRSSTPLKKKINRWFFYIYYPLHMMIIFMIAHI